MSKILLIDNYDSFTFNLYHYLEEVVNEPIVVLRNDEITEDVANEFDKIVISPGPGLPKTAGNLMSFLDNLEENKKVLGICLGQQAIAELFGMKLMNLGKVVHGQKSKVKVVDSSEALFQGLPEQFYVGRYHSWVIDPKSVTDDFKVTSIVDDETIMSISHKKLSIKAVQFHPESILTEYGKQMLSNWVSIG